MSLTFNGLNGLSFGDGTSQNTAASGFGFKNRIINGDMRIDQRNIGSSITPTAGQYSVDRWQSALNVSSKFTLQRVTDAPPGFAYSLKATSTSAYTLGSGELTSIRQYIEGYNFADFDWGLSTAKPAALSFWTKSSLTGSFGGIVGNDSDRTYPFLYTINAANTWEYKTISISTGPTSGYRDITNNVGASVIFSFGAGSSFLGTPGQWNNANQYGATGQTSLVATNGATLQITGVQLEKGSSPTSFDYRPYTLEDVLSKRYFEKSYDFDSAIGSFTAGWRGTSTNGTVFAEGPGWSFSVPKRVIPTVTFYNAVSGASGRSYQVSTAASISVSARYIGTTGIGIIDYSSSGGQNSYYIHYTANAEL